MIRIRLNSATKKETRMRIAASALALLLLSPIWLMGQATGEKTTSVEFNRDIRPLLSDKCFTCHGPDQARRLTKLRFDIEAEAKQDLGGRFAIVPGESPRAK